MQNVEIMSSLLKECRKYYLDEIMILKSIVNIQLNKRACETRILLASACSTGTAIHSLGERIEYFYSEMMMLARSFIEKITNYCYLQVCDDDQYTKFLLHPFYRAFHNANKKKYTDYHSISVKYSQIEEIKKHPKITEALNKFSHTNSSKCWSDLSIDQKVNIISCNSKICAEFFLMNTLTIYSNASEALHGSLYGCALPTGAYTFDIDSSNLDEVNENLSKNVVLLYIQLGLIIGEVFKLLPENEKIKSLFVESNKNKEIALRILKKAFNRNDQTISQ